VEPTGKLAGDAGVTAIEDNVAEAMFMERLAVAVKLVLSVA
jgi:hypothetical protein